MSVRLDYSSNDPTQTCPDRETLEHDVAAILGYNPFSDQGDRFVRVRIDGRENSFIGTVSLENSTGHIIGERTLESQSTNCHELASSIELAVAIAIDPLVLTRPDPEETEEEPNERPPQTPSEPEPERQIRFRGQINLLGSLGTAPKLALGISLQAGIHWRFFSCVVEGRADIPTTESVPGGKIETSILTLNIVPCLHWRFLYGCLVGGSGALRASGLEFDETAQVTLPHWSFGGRLGFEYRVIGPLLIHARVDVLTEIAQITLTANGETLWTTPPVSFNFGGGLTFLF